MAREAGRIRIGVGGWTFPPWRGVFYPDGLPHKRELDYASRALSAIEINGTYYSTFTPATWRKWRDETPDDFVFTVKASRYCTNRKVLAGAGDSVARFLAQGIVELGPKLGPIVWQFMPTKRFDADDFGAFLDELPREKDGIPLRHAVEVRHASFDCDDFVRLARDYGVAIVCDQGGDFPEIDTRTADFTYARFLSSRPNLKQGMTGRDLAVLADRCRAWSTHGEVYGFFISGAKVRNPAAALALQQVLEPPAARGSPVERKRAPKAKGAP